MKKFKEVLVEDEMPSKIGNYIIRRFGNNTYESRYYEPRRGDSFWRYVEYWLKEEDEIDDKNGDWLMTRCEKTSERYLEAEKFIMGLKWWERIFISGKIRKFMKSRLTKYNF